jgi:hypothetical protein
MSVQNLISTWILTMYRMHHPARYLNKARHQTAKSWSQRNATNNKEAHFTKINRRAGLVTESEWPTRNNDRALESQGMLGTKSDGKVNGQRVDALNHPLHHLRRSARAWRCYLWALSRMHLRTTCFDRTGNIYRWPFTTETNLTGAGSDSAAATGSDATTNLVCQKRLHPWRSLTCGRLACSRRLATCRRAIGGAASKRSGRRCCADLRAPCHDHLICPRQVLGE